MTEMHSSNGVLTDDTRDLRVVAVDDHELLAQSLVGLFEVEPGFCPVGLAHSLTEARALLPQAQPDVVVLDQMLPDGNGILALPELQALVPDAAFVILTANPGGAEVRAAAAGGAFAVVAKSGGIADLVGTVRCAGNGYRTLAPEVLADVVQRVPQQPEPEPDGTPAEGLRSR